MEVVAALPVNPFGHAPVAAAPSILSLISVEQQRAVAEVQASMIVARASPRDQLRSTEQIMEDCTRLSLAESASYSYAKGGTNIAGPSIRLLEAIARRWGNLACGVKELTRHEGYSECVAYARDLETNFSDERTFVVKHWRDSKQGGYLLKDEREIYELIANMGARRKRACLEAVIPQEVTDVAMRQCELTLKTKAEVTPEKIQQMVQAFGELGVTPMQIERRIQRRLDAITPALVIQLRRIYTSLKDGMSSARDWFEPEPVADPPADPPARAHAIPGSEPMNRAELIRNKLTARRKPAAAEPAEPAPETPPQPAPDAPPGDAAEPGIPAPMLDVSAVIQAAQAAATVDDYVLVSDLARTLTSEDAAAAAPYLKEARVRVGG